MLHLADKLVDSAAIPRGCDEVVLNLGGAQCVYPILGAAEYVWRFVDTDVASPPDRQTPSPSQDLRTPL